MPRCCSVADAVLSCLREDSPAAPGRSVRRYPGSRGPVTHQGTSIEIIVADNAGFCFGVERALELVMKERERIRCAQPTGSTASGPPRRSRARRARPSRRAHDEPEPARPPIVTLGPLIHNPQVVERLRAEGVEQVRSVSEVAQGTMVIPSHGISPELVREARERGLRLLDATCPFVARAQDNVRTLATEGYQVIIVGDRGHPEVAGLVGAAGGAAVVIQDESELDDVQLAARVGLVVQTTQAPARLRAVAGALAERVRELRAYNTICAATSQRQEAAVSLARQVDVMIVVGGKNSANTNRLRQVCAQVGVETHHVETAAELDPAWFAGKSRAGVTAGASTPDWVISDVAEALRRIGG
jgi:small subunit ribosomal protein S1